MDIVCTASRQHIRKYCLKMDPHLNGLSRTVPIVTVPTVSAVGLIRHRPYEYLAAYLMDMVFTASRQNLRKYCLELDPHLN